jgi:hypothetical protein
MSPDSSFHHRPPLPFWKGTSGKSSISSPDPLLLSSFPRIHHADADDPNSCHTDHSTILQMTSGTAKLDQSPGAGPSASPSLSIHLPSCEASVSSQLSPLPDPSTVPSPPTPDINHNGTPAIENDIDAAGGRYSMRTRQPRQLKPYAFDRLEYKYQLKHHPDAIVKFNGRRSPVESSSRSSEGGIDGAAENSGGEHPSEDAQMLPRAKGKKRHRTSTGHPSAPPPVAHRRTSGVQLSLGSPSLDRRFTGSSAIADLTLVASIPDVGGNGDPAEAATWYPDAFNDGSSGVGSDDMPLSTDQNDLRDSHIPPPLVKRKRVLLLLYDVCL